MKTFDKYILDGTEVKPCENLFEWADWFENSDNRLVKQTLIGHVRISTVFLGLDQTFGMRKPPILFETAAFHKWEFITVVKRYATWKEAIKGHDNAIRLFKRRRLFNRKKFRLPRKFKKNLLKRALAIVNS